MKSQIPPTSSAPEISLRKLNLVGGSFASIAAKTVSFAATIYQAHVLGASGFGQYGAILVTLNLFGIAAQASLGATSTNLLSRYASQPRDIEEIASTIIALGAILASCATASLGLASYGIAQAFFHAPELAAPLAISSASLAILSIYSIADGTLSAFRQFSTRNALPLIQAASFLALSIPLTYYAGVLGAVLAFMTSNMVALAISVHAIKKVFLENNIKVRPQLYPSRMREILSLSLPMIGNSALVLCANWYVSTVIAKSADGFSGLGAYSAASQLRILILTLPFLVQSTFAPLIARSSAQSNQEELERLSDQSLALTSILSGAAALFLGTLAAPAARLYGKDFGSHADLFAISSLLAFLMAIANFQGMTLIGIGRQRATLIANALYSAIVIAISHRAATSLAAEGVLYAMIIAQIAQILTMLALGSIPRPGFIWWHLSSAPLPLIITPIFALKHLGTANACIVITLCIILYIIFSLHAAVKFRIISAYRFRKVLKNGG